MSSDSKRPHEDDAYFKAVEEEIRKKRKFSMASAIGEEGGGFLAGGTPILPTQEAAAVIGVFLEVHMVDYSGVLRHVLDRRIKEDIVLLSKYVDVPLKALAHVIDHILELDERLYELVRQVDAEYGRMMDERPYFQKPGAPPHPDDEYTHQSVRVTLTQLRVVLTRPG